MIFCLLVSEINRHMCICVCVYIRVHHSVQRSIPARTVYKQHCNVGGGCGKLSLFLYFLLELRIIGKLGISIVRRPKNSVHKISTRMCDILLCSKVLAIKGAKMRWSFPFVMQHV